MGEFYRAGDIEIEVFTVGDVALRQKLLGDAALRPRHQVSRGSAQAHP